MPASPEKSENISPAAFVCGWPVQHSRSPLVHRYWLAEHHLAGSYEKVPVEPGTLAAFFDRIRQGEFVGGNITLPHKEDALKLADAADDAAKAIGAANTVWMEAGTLRATNTDWIGFVANLDEQAPGWDRADSGGASVLVVGAGGAARGVIYGLLQRGVKSVHIANRTISKAATLANDFDGNLTALPLDDVAGLAESVDLVVNTSSMGMRGQPPMSEDVINIIPNLPGHAVVCDIVYTPLETPLLEAAEKTGLTTADGLGMLLHQAVPGFEKWFGVRPKVSEKLRDLVISDLPGDTG